MIVNQMADYARLGELLTLNLGPEKSNFHTVVRPSYWIVALPSAFYFAQGRWETAGIFVALIILFIWVHEAGHCLAFIACGSSTSIELWAFGGFAHGGIIHGWRWTAVLCAGPLAGILFGMALMALNRQGIAPQLPDSVWYLAKLSVLFNLFNLLPILPMDGGKIAVGLIDGKIGTKADIYVNLLSILLTVILGVISVGLWKRQAIPFLMLLIGFYTIQFRDYWEASGSLARRKDGAASLGLDDAERDLGQKRFKAAITRLLSIRESAHSDSLRRESSALLARAYEAAGDYERAYEALKSFSVRLEGKSVYDFQRIAVAAKRYDESLALGEKIFQGMPRPATALLIARAYAGKNDEKKALAWLGKGKHAGEKEIEEVLAASEFDELRAAGRLKRFRRSG